MSRRFVISLPSGTTHVVGTDDRTVCGKRIPAHRRTTQEPVSMICPRCAAVEWTPEGEAA